MLRKKGMTWDHIRKRTSDRIGESCNFYLKSEKSLSRTYPFLQYTSGRWSFARFSGFLEYFLFALRKLFSLSIAKLPFTSGRLESKGTPPWKPRNCWLLSALNKTEKGKNHINKNVPLTTQTRNNATLNTLQLCSLSSEIFFLYKEQFLPSDTQKESLYSISCHAFISVNQLIQYANLLTSSFCFSFNCLSHLLKNSSCFLVPLLKKVKEIIISYWKQ